MKKLYIFAAVLALLTLSLNAQMQAKKKVANKATTTEKVDMATNSLETTRATTDKTICDGTNTNNYLPVYGLYCDDYQINQMIYPENLLTDLVGKTLTSMTFYATEALDANLSSVGWNVKLGTTTQTSFASTLASITRLVPDDVTTVAQGYVITSGINTMTITFTTPFTYNGGNLLVDFQSTAEGQYKSASFYGVNQSTYTAYNSYRSSNATPNQNGHYSNGSARQFLPKVTFTYNADPVHDLSVALSAPATAGAGSTVTLTATVTNNGEFDENGYTVTFTANGTTINTQTGGSLAQGASATFTYTYTTTDAQGGTNVNFGASVACTNDAVATNNEATASTSVLACPPPENVAATAIDNSGTMTWDVPIIASTVTQVTETFENTADNVLPSGWTAIDNDGDGYNWYHHININDGNNISTHDGIGAMASESYNNDTQSALHPDNWLITPLAVLDGTFSFWAVGQDDSYASEIFGVFVTTGDDPSNLSNYVQVAGDFTATDTYAQYTANLSAYAGQLGYIAIVHHNVSDQFILDVDDVTYQAAVPGEQPTSYNIYLEGQLVGNVDANTFEYTFNNLSDGTYNCAVSAVYSYGESAAVPASFTIDTTNPTIEISPETQTISDAAAGTLTITGTDIEGNINASLANNTDWYLNPTSFSNTGGEASVSYTGRALSASNTVTATAANDNTVTASATVNYVADLYIVGNFGGNGWDFSNGTNMSYNNGIYTASLTASAGDYILFARLLGNGNPWNTRDVFGPNSGGDWWMQGDNASGNIDLYDDDPIYFTEGGTYIITINANDGTFTITKTSGELTAPPVITHTSDGEYVTITATGNGTVTLNVPGYDPVSGEGSVSITVPCGVVSNTITVTATAKEDGKDESTPASEQITIPAGSDWLQMDGTYNNPNDLLSFQRDGEDIALIDQFLASTLENEHPDHYTYTLRQTANGEAMTSTPVSIPVYKTSSTMQGFYTKGQVDTADLKMELRSQVINSEMFYNVNPDRNTLYYSLYRGDKNADYPVIDVPHRVSQLQRFQEMVGDYPQYFLFETHQDGVAPRYDHIGSQIVERLDTNYVQGEFNDELSYVPVIWTYGLYTARGDGKNNSYGSDIKREILGGVNATITGEKSDYSAYGKWTANGVEYCVYTPVITITGTPPAIKIDNDSDKSVYVPYMYRAWCLYEGAHDFTRNSDGQLIDNGVLQAPLLLGTVVSNESGAIIGGSWQPGMGRLPWAFGIPVSEDGSNVTFAIRFYYKKTVTEAGQGEPNSLRDGEEGEEYYIVECEGDAQSITTAINELFNGRVPVETIYYNSVGMQSDKPFDGINIVVTRYSDGTTSTSKIVR